MEAKNPIQCIARIATVFMATLLILLLVVVVQAITIELAPVLWTASPAPPSKEPNHELTAEQARTQRILRAKKEFLPDGTLHLVTESGRNRWQPQYGPYPADAPTGERRIYDVNDNLLWEGLATERPYDYLSWAWNVGGDRDRFSLHQMRSMQTATPDAALRTLEIPVATADELLEMWRYDSWADCFVGYSLEGGRIGYLSAVGLTDAKMDVRPFGSFQSFRVWWPEHSSSPTLLWQTEQRICLIDFASRQVEQFLESPRRQIEDVTMNKTFLLWTLNHWISGLIPAQRDRRRRLALNICHSQVTPKGQHPMYPVVRSSRDLQYVRRWIRVRPFRQCPHRRIPDLRLL